MCAHDRARFFGWGRRVILRSVPPWESDPLMSGQAFSAAEATARGASERGARTSEGARIAARALVLGVAIATT